MKNYLKKLLSSTLIASTTFIYAQKTYTNMGNTITIEQFSKDTVLEGDQRKVTFKIKNPQNYQNVKFHLAGKNPIEPNNGEYQFKETATTGLYDERGYAKIMKEYFVKFTFKNVESHFSFIDTYYIKEREIVFKPNCATENALYQNADNYVWISVPSLKDKFLVSIDDLETDHHTYLKPDTATMINSPSFKRYKINTKLKHIQLSVSTLDSFILGQKEYYLIDLPKSNISLILNGQETSKTEFTTSEISKLEIKASNQLSTKAYKLIVSIHVERAGKTVLDKKESEGNLLQLKANVKLLRPGDIIKLKINNLQVWPNTTDGDTSKSDDTTSNSEPVKGVYSFAIDKEIQLKVK